MEVPQKSAAELRHEAAGPAYRQAREWQAIEAAQRRAERQARAAERAAIKAAKAYRQPDLFAALAA